MDIKTKFNLGDSVRVTVSEAHWFESKIAAIKVWPHGILYSLEYVRVESAEHAKFRSAVLKIEKDAEGRGFPAPEFWYGEEQLSQAQLDWTQKETKVRYSDSLFEYPSEPEIFPKANLPEQKLCPYDLRNGFGEISESQSPSAIQHKFGPQGELLELKGIDHSSKAAQEIISAAYQKTGKGIIPENEKISSRFIPIDIKVETNSEHPKRGSIRATIISEDLIDDVPVFTDSPEEIVIKGCCLLLDWTGVDQTQEHHPDCPRAKK